MKIAFISYEYPPETGGGGIGTYLFQCVQHFPKYGHTVVVFCGTSAEEPFWENESVYRIPCSNWQDFNSTLPDYFEKIHEIKNFDIIEGTDFRAGGIELFKGFPQIPFVTRAHSANYIVDIFLRPKLTLVQKIRFLGGLLSKGKFPRLPKLNEQHYSDEKLLVKESKALLSPSYSLGVMYKKLGWRDTFDVIPYMFSAPSEIFEIQPKTPTENIRILFFGRLEVRKGILEILKAIPIVLRNHKNVIFQFVGKSSFSPDVAFSMSEYIILKSKKFLPNIEVAGAVPNTEVYRILEAADIVLMPSLYDNFPVACMEAMAAGRPVVGSRSGGMAEMIEDKINGLLVNPQDAMQIAKKIEFLIENPDQRISMGQEARKIILQRYHPEVIIPQQVEFYKKLMKSYSTIEK